MRLSTKFFCLGPVSRKSHDFHEKGYINFCCQNGQDANINATINLFNKCCSFESGLSENMEALFNNCRKYLMLLSSLRTEYTRAVNVPELGSKLRDEIVLFFNYIITYLKSFSEDKVFSADLIPRLENELWTLRLLLHKLSCAKLPDSVLAFYASSIDCLDTNPAFYLIHCHLDCRWLYIKLIEALEEVKFQSNSCTTQFALSENCLCIEKEIMMLISELLWIAIVRYEKCNKEQLTQFSAFSCVCVKELWLMLLHYPFKFQDFWTFFNQAMRVIIDNKEPPREISYCSSRMSPPEYLPCSNRSEFALWMISDLVKLQKYDCYGKFSIDNKVVANNFELVEDIIKELINDSKAATEEAMRSIVPMLQKINSVWGHTKSNIVTTLWEYYYKRINSAFYVPGSKLNSMVVISKSGSELLDQVKERMDGNTRGKYENSYLMFLRLLGEHLQTQRKSGESALRLCGRVFIKFPVSRVERLQELQDLGVFHLSSLYLTLAIGSNTPSTIEKLVELLSAIPREDIKEGKHEMVWKGYAAALLALAEMRVDISDTSKIVMEHFRWCDERHNHGPINQLVNVTKLLFEKDIGATRGIHFLIGTWMETYAKSATRTEAARLLSCFIPLLRQLCNKSNGNSPIILRKIEDILPNLLKNEMSMIGAEVAALFTIVSSVHRTETFKFWADCMDCSLAAKYLSILLSTSSEDACGYLLEASNLAVQVWIRCVFLYGNNEDTTNLLAIVKELEQMKSLSIDWNQEEPFLSFLDYFRTEYTLRAVLYEKSAIREKFAFYFIKFDKWLESQTKNIDVLAPDVINRFYRYCGELFSRVPNLIYTKSNPKNILKLIMDSLLLSPQIYKVDYTPSKTVLNGIRDHFALFVQGLLTLDFDMDPYVGRLFRDLIIQYIPRFVAMPILFHPLLPLLSNRVHSQKILTVLCHFLQVRSKSVHPHAANVLKLLQQAINDSATPEVIFDSTVDCIIDIFLQLDDLHPLKSKCLDFLASALTVPANRLRIVIALSEACKKSLAFNSTGWFRTVSRIVPLCRDEVTGLLPVLEQELAAVERRRGIERDAALRNLLENFKKTLANL